MRPLATLALLAPSLVLAQIRPEFAYNGVGRAFPVEIKGRGRLEVRLLQGGTAEVLLTAQTKGGKQDLAKLFPSLWTAKRPTVVYAQLIENGKPKGPALVLVPMIDPPLAHLKADGKTIEYARDENPTFAGVHAWVDRDILLETTLGNMRFRLRPDCAPNTCRIVMDLVQGGFYRDVIWHRIINASRRGPFVIQGGDPSGSGAGGPGFNFDLEPSTLPFDFGVLSMARSTDPNTNGSQIVVNLSREATKHLDGLYTSFGQLIEGAETVRKTAAVPIGEHDRPKDPPLIRRAVLVDAAPYAKPD